MEYLPTLGEKWLHSRGNVGKYSLHGSYGIGNLNCSGILGTLPILFTTKKIFDEVTNRRQKSRVPDRDGNLPIRGLSRSFQSGQL